jgi:hypothetical protein
MMSLKSAVRTGILSGLKWATIIWISALLLFIPLIVLALETVFDTELAGVLQDTGSIVDEIVSWEFVVRLIGNFVLVYFALAVWCAIAGVAASVSVPPKSAIRSGRK